MLVVSSLVVNCGFTSFAPSIAVCFTTMTLMTINRYWHSSIPPNVVQDKVEGGTISRQCPATCDVVRYSTPTEAETAVPISDIVGSLDPKRCDFKPFPKENSHWHYNH